MITFLHSDCRRSRGNPRRQSRSEVAGRVLQPGAVAYAAALGIAFAVPVWGASPDLPRDFTLPLPLFSAPGSAWVEDATAARVLPQSDRQILTYYRVVCGDDTDLVNTEPGSGPIIDVGFDEFTVPIFLAGSGAQDVDLCDYVGQQEWPNQKWDAPTFGGPVTVPACSGDVRPSDPPGAESDGWLVLFDQTTGTSYDFWQATTVRNGPCDSLGGGQVGDAILEVGYADFFAVDGDGTNPPGVFSARAAGTPLLAGLIVPEDIESGSIDHALAVGLIGLRNLSPDPCELLATDVYFPAATTECQHYNTNPDAIAAGQRLRARPTLVDGSGNIIDEDARLAPITRMVFRALRTYGAYPVDNAGAFTLWAEDIHTAQIDLTDDEINALIGEPAGTPLPAGATKWQILIEAVNADLWELPIPFAYGTCAGASSSVITANFDIVEPAGGGGGCTPPAITTEPTDATIDSGGSATLRVAATGTDPLSLQWYRGSSGDTADPIAGASAASYTTPPLTGDASFWVRVSNACGSTDSRTAAVTVRPPGGGGGNLSLIPAVAHNPGVGSTLWRTDVAAVNTAAEEARVTLTFLPSAGGARITAVEFIEPGATVVWGNILESVFGLSPGVSASGSLAIDSSVALVVSARTFNLTAGGSYGQYLPATTADSALAAGETGVLPQIKDNEDYRTNIGVIGLGDGSATVRIHVFDADGDQVGAAKSVTVGPGRWTQVNDVFSAIGAGEEHDIAYATVTATPAGALVWAYASVVDNRSGDPTTVPVLVGGGD